VRDDWLWATIQTRSSAPEGIFLQVANPQMYDAELFEITWGPTVHALGYAFDKSNDPSIIQKAVAGNALKKKFDQFYLIFFDQYFR